VDKKCAESGLDRYPGVGHLLDPPLYPPLEPPLIAPPWKLPYRRGKALRSSPLVSLAFAVENILSRTEKETRARSLPRTSLSPRGIPISSTDDASSWEISTRDERSLIIEKSLDGWKGQCSRHAQGSARPSTRVATSDAQLGVDPRMEGRIRFAKRLRNWATLFPAYLHVRLTKEIPFCSEEASRESADRGAMCYPRRYIDRKNGT